MKGLFHWSGRYYDFDVAVIGAGSGGLTVTVGCQKLGLRTTLIEGRPFGGDCLNFGCVPSKTLIASAAVAHTARRAIDFGIKCSEPSTDWGEVKARIELVKDKIRDHENAGYFRHMGMYEREGLLPPPLRRSAVHHKGYRMYAVADLRRLRFIVRAKELGFTLKEIAALLALRRRTRPCAAVRAEAQRHLADIEARLRDLTRIRNALRRLISECAQPGTEAACPILDFLDQED